MDTLSVREIIEQVDRRQIRVPAFQRGFVWEPDRVAFFMDSIFKQYPFGSLLLWRAQERLKCERKLGPFTLPEPVADYPLDYVLDGQQRITSLYSTFQRGREVPQSSDWKDIYYDYSLPFDAQDTQFFSLLPSEVENSRHFPLRCLFDTTSYRRATAGFDEPTADKIDKMQTVFKETRIPAQIIRPAERQTVAVIFERINRQGVPLDTLQLLSAWTWSEDFQLQTEFDELATDLEEYGIRSVDTEENILLRCCAAVLAYDPTPDKLVEIPGDEVRRRFAEVRNGLKGALDFLQMNLKVESVANLPFQTILVPLSVFFAAGDGIEIRVSEEQRKRLLRWFWRVAFARRYSSGVLRNLREDIAQVRILKAGQASKIGGFTCAVTTDFFALNNFTMSAVNTKTTILLLAQQNPRSLVSGTPVDLAPKLREFNKTEFHHLMPRAYLRTVETTKYNHNALANIAFITRAENRHLGGVAPSQYRSRLAANETEILEAAVCPSNLFGDQYDAFIEERSSLLAERARRLIEVVT
ncbi:MAG: GmrSD restriction endonuclease domain-containing protein [Planctomycetota bacterium]|jgi:hypothetical protein